MGNNICPYCGAHLDPDERCGCQDEEAVILQEPGNNDAIAMERKDNND